MAMTSDRLPWVISKKEKEPNWTKECASAAGCSMDKIFLNSLFSTEESTMMLAAELQSGSTLNTKRQQIIALLSIKANLASYRR